MINFCLIFICKPPQSSSTPRSGEKQYHLTRAPPSWGGNNHWGERGVSTPPVSAIFNDKIFIKVKTASIYHKKVFVTEWLSGLVKSNIKYVIRLWIPFNSTISFKGRFLSIGQSYWNFPFNSWRKNQVIPSSSFHREWLWESVLPSATRREDNGVWEDKGFGV